MQWCQDSGNSRDIWEPKKRFGLWILKWLVNQQILRLGRTSLITSDSMNFFSALIRGVMFMLMVWQVFFIFFVLFYICQVFCKYIHTCTCTYIVFIKTAAEPKWRLCFIYTSVKYICLTFLSYSFLFVHFSGHYWTLFLIILWLLYFYVLGAPRCGFISALGMPMNFKVNKFWNS